MSCITTKIMFGCYLLQIYTSDGITGIEIGTLLKPDNHFMNHALGSFLWYSMVCGRDLLEKTVLHIDSMELHPS